MSQVARNYEVEDTALPEGYSYKDATAVECSSCEERGGNNVLFDVEDRNVVWQCSYCGAANVLEQEEE